MKSYIRLALPLLASASALSMTAALAEPSPELIAAAQGEGMLTTIALPHSWCGYGEVIAAFKEKYGLEVNELNSNAGFSPTRLRNGTRYPMTPKMPTGIGMATTMGFWRLV